MNSIRKIMTQDLFPEDLNIWLRIVYGTGTKANSINLTACIHILCYH